MQLSPALLTLVLLYLVGNGVLVDSNRLPSGQEISEQGLAEAQTNCTGQLLEAKKKIYQLQEEKLSLLGSLINMKNEKAFFMDNQTSQQETIKNIAIKLQITEQEIVKLNDLMNKLKSRNLELKVKLSSCEAANKDLTTQLYQLDLKCHAAEKQLQQNPACEQEKNMLLEKLMKYKGIVKRLRSDLYEIDNDRDRKDLEITSLRFKNDDIEERYDQCRGQLKKLPQKLNKLKQKTDTLNTQVVKLQEQNNYLVTENYHLKSAVTKQNENIAVLQYENQNFKRENITFLSLLNKLMNNESVFDAILTQNLTQVDGLNNNTIDYSSLQSEELRNKLMNQFEQNVTKLQYKYLECATMFGVLHKEIDLLSLENFKLKALNFELNSHVQELKSNSEILRSDITTFLTEISTLRNNSQVLTSKLLASEEMINNLRDTNGKVNEVNWNLQTENAKLFRDKHNLNTLLEQQQEQIRALRSDLQKCQASTVMTEIQNQYSLLGKTNLLGENATSIGTVPTALNFHNNGSVSNVSMQIENVDSKILSLEEEVQIAKQKLNLQEHALSYNNFYNNKTT